MAILGYVARSGEFRYWRHFIRPKAICYDCETPYGEGPFGDLVLPNEIWEKINPTYHKGAGLLCPNCIFERLAAIGVSVEDGVKIYPASVGGE
jgi:uncharacterized protein (DUF983 family)